MLKRWGSAGTIYLFVIISLEHIFIGYAHSGRSLFNGTIKNHTITHRAKATRGPQQRLKMTRIKISTVLSTTNDFKTMLLNSEVYVDKTLIIREIVEGDTMISIARPRRTGKSMTLNMLHKFFEIEVDQKGVPLTRDKQMNYKFFMGGEIDFGRRKIILRRLNIAKHKEIIDAHQGKYPVILLNFTDVRGSSYEEIKRGIIRQISIMYLKHAYLRNHNPSTNSAADFSRRELEKYFTGRINTDAVEYSLRYLTRILSVYFNRRVYVLVDSYDTPINNAYREFGDRVEECKKVRLLVDFILNSAIKNSNHVERVVITGVLRLPKVDSISGNATATRSTLLTGKFPHFNGFTQEEVDELLAKVPTKSHPTKIKSKYVGYNWARRIFYNPWSVMQCLDNKGRLGYYWLESTSSHFDAGFQSDKMQQAFQNLLQDRSVNATMYDQNSPGDSESVFYKLLLFEGYLNAIPIRRGGSQYFVMIPNHELKEVFVSKMKKWLANLLNIDLNEYQRFVNLLTSGQTSEFKRQFEQYIPSVSRRSFNENKLHSLIMSGVVSSLASKYTVEKGRLKNKFGYLLTPYEGDTQMLIACKLDAKDEDEENEYEDAEDEYADSSI